MAFVFRLETVLKHRKTLRDMAQKELTEAEVKLRDHLRKIDSMYQQIDEYRNEAGQVQGAQRISMPQLDNIESFIISMKKKIETAKSESRQMMQVVEAKRERLVEKAKEYKAIDLLKEKHFEQYKQLQKKKEAKIIDDLNQMRHKKEIA